VIGSGWVGKRSGKSEEYWQKETRLNSLDGSTARLPNGGTSASLSSVPKARMTVHLALAMCALVAGLSEKAPKPSKESDQPPARTVFLGKQDYRLEEGGRQPLVLKINMSGQVIEKWEITDKGLENWVRQHCKGRDKAFIVIGVTEPRLTTIRTVDDTIERLKKYVPKETVVTFWIQDQE
jgi:hypothetical protein